MNGLISLRLIAGWVHFKEIRSEQAYEKNDFFSFCIEDVPWSSKAATKFYYRTH
jgi:hypothetical protein